MGTLREDHAIHIQNLIEQDDDCQVVPLYVAEELETKIKQLESQVMSVEEADDICSNIPHFIYEENTMCLLEGEYSEKELVALSTLLKSEQDND